MGKLQKLKKNIYICLAGLTALHWININAGEAFKAQSNVKCFKVSNELNLEI